MAILSATYARVQTAAPPSRGADGAGAERLPAGRPAACRPTPSLARDIAGAAPGLGTDAGRRILAEVPVLRRHAQSLLYSRADAEDLVQDCLETALQKAGSLHDPGRLRGWLFSILNNLFLMRLRREARRGRVLPIEEFADSLAASVPAGDRDRARDLARAMGRLSAEHRQILLLINLEGQSYQEAADALGVPIGTVMSRLARARQRLRAILEGDELRTVD